MRRSPLQHDPSSHGSLELRNNFRSILYNYLWFGSSVRYDDEATQKSEKYLRCCVRFRRRRANAAILAGLLGFALTRTGGPPPTLAVEQSDSPFWHRSLQQLINDNLVLDQYALVRPILSRACARLVERLAHVQLLVRSDHSIPFPKAIQSRPRPRDSSRTARTRGISSGSRSVPGAEQIRPADPGVSACDGIPLLIERSDTLACRSAPRAAAEANGALSSYLGEMMFPKGLTA